MSHPGEQAVRRRAGAEIRPGWAGFGPTIPAVAAEFLRRQRMLVLAASDEQGAAWAGLVVGPAGFAAVGADQSVTIDALPAPTDPLHGLLDNGRDVGLLAVEPQSRRRMRVNGSVHTVEKRLVVRPAEVFSNCQRYIQARHLVDGSVAPGATRRTAGTQLAIGQQQWVSTADTFFIATYTAENGADASHRGGNPGFVTVLGPNQLVWPDYPGNRLYMTLGNLDLNPACGLLFLDWERGDTLHITGRAHIDWDPNSAAAVPGAQRLVRFDVDTVVQVAGASPLRWAFDGYSPANPAVASRTGVPLEA